MARSTTFRARLTWNIVLLSTGCLLLFSVAVLGTAVQTVRAHFEEMAVDSTLVSGRLLRQMQIFADHDVSKRGDVVPNEKEYLKQTFLANSRALMGDRAILFDESGVLISDTNRAARVADSGEAARLSLSAVRLLSGQKKYHISVPAKRGIWVGVPLVSTDNSTLFAFFLHHSMDDAHHLEIMTVVYVLCFAGILAVLAVLIGARLSQRLSQPLRTLHEAANRIGDGKLEHRIEAGLQDEFGQIADAFNQMASSLQRYMRNVEIEAQRREQLESEFRIAAHLQQSLLPNKLPDVEGLELSALSRPAREVGGDFYDAAAIGGETIYFAIGDATNKGLPAAIHITECASAVRTLARQGFTPARILRQVNTQLYEDLGDSCRFVTLFLARLDLHTRTLTYSIAGHNPPILIRKSHAEPIFLNGGSGLPLGITGDAIFDDETIQLCADDLLLLYTDGLTEAPNRDGELFGMERVVWVLSENRLSPAGSILNSMLTQVEKHECGVQMDDLTMLVARLT